MLRAPPSGASLGRRRNEGGGRRYVHIEVGHVAQNICLQATSLGLGAVVVGAFDDRDAKRAAGLPPREEPLALLPVGRPA